MYSANITTFHCLQDTMSIVALWFQDCIPSCYSSFSAAVIRHCNLQYLPVVQNGCAELALLSRHLLSKWYLGTDSWFNHSLRKQHGGNHPSFVHKRLPCGDVIENMLYLEFIRRLAGKILTSKSWLRDAFHVDKKYYVFRHVSMAVASVLMLEQDESFTYSDLLDLAKVISVQVLFARHAEYTLPFPVLLRLNLECLPSDTLRLLFQ